MMAGIHGIVYILIGALVALVSWKIDFEDLQAFFWIGIFFAAIGIFKLIFSLTGKKDKKPEHHRGTQSHFNKTQTHHAPHHAAAHQYKRCPKCNNVMKASDNFCPRCGARA